MTDKTRKYDLDFLIDQAMGDAEAIYGNGPAFAIARCIITNAAAVKAQNDTLTRIADILQNTERQVVSFAGAHEALVGSLERALVDIALAPRAKEKD